MRFKTLAWPEHRANRLTFFLIVLIAIAVRGHGLSWGLPSSENWYSFHPDEIDIVGTAVRLPHTGGDPQFFNYGSLTIYLTYALGQLAGSYPLLDPVTSLTVGYDLNQSLDHWRQLHLLSRSLTVFLAVVTVWAVFVLAKSLALVPSVDPAKRRTPDRPGAERQALCAAFFLALAPGHVVHSHYATVDVPATAFVTMSAAAAAMIFHSNHPRWIMLSAALAGLAAATKYNAGLVLLLPIGARALTDWKSSAPAGAVPPPWTLFLPMLAAPVVIAFLVACPFSMLNFPLFWQHLMQEVQHVQTGSGLIFVGVGPGWWNHLNVNFPYAMTTPLFLAGFGGWIAGVARKERSMLFCSFFMIPYGLMIGGATVSFLRYVIPLLPFLCVAAARLPWDLAQPRRRWAPLVAAVLLVEFLAALGAVSPFARTDTRLAAGRWMTVHRKSGDSAGMLTFPWFWSPALVPANGGPRFAGFASGVLRGRRITVCAGWDATLLERERPEWFATSEFETRDEERLGDRRAAEFMQALLHYYGAPRRVFKSPAFPSLPGRNLWTPHDWLYPNPEIRVYRRRP